MLRAAISMVAAVLLLWVAASEARNCSEAEERELAGRHARCVDSGQFSTTRTTSKRT